MIRNTELDQHCKFSELNQKQQSIASTVFYVKSVHNKVSFVIEDDEIAESVIDSANDLGCDFIYRDDGRVMIMQSKFRKQNADEPTSEISHFKSILKCFRNQSLSPNKHLRDIISDIDWANDTFILIYMTYGRIDNQARIVADQLPDYPLDVQDIDQRCEWRFLDQQDLNVELRNAINLHRGVSPEKVRLYPVGQKGKRGAESVIEVEAGDYRSYIMALDATQIVRTYETLGGDALFSLNIRNFIGNTSTNKEIINSAQEDPNSFFLYNNGISCLATSVSVGEGFLEIQGLQVINGAQTVKALVHVGKRIKQSHVEYWAKNKPVVLVRITEVSEGYGGSGRVREKITRYNNTQNTVKISDFRSNDDVQVNLAQQFKGIKRRGKNVIYIAKRTDRIPPNSEVIRMEEFAKSIYSFLYDPTAFSGSSTFLFNDEKNGGYLRVFGDENSLWEKMPDEEFRLRASIYWISQEFAAYLKAVRDLEEDPDARSSLERKWLLIYAASVVVKYIYKKNDNWKNQLRKLYRGNWALKQDDKQGEILLVIFNTAKAGVVQTYKNSKLYNKEFNHRNWMRSRNTPGDIKNILETLVLPMLPINVGDIPG